MSWFLTRSHFRHKYEESKYVNNAYVMGIKCCILLLDILLFGCGCGSADVDGLNQDVGSGGSNAEAIDSNLHSSASQFRELTVPKHSKISGVRSPRNVQPTFTLNVLAQDSDTGGANAKSEPLPSQGSLQGEGAGWNATTVESESLITAASTRDSSTLSQDRQEAIVTPVTSMELQQNSLEQNAHLEAAAVSAEPTSQRTASDYKTADVETPVTNVPLDAASADRYTSATERPSPDNEKNQATEKMPTFAEWKEKMLAVQEKGGEQVPETSGAHSKKKVSKGGRNYASYECGAKVLAANPEADGTGRILNEMMDEYMLNPCKVKIWFVIELCETIQISQIEIANFELFSSMPKDFAVFMSDRYPIREWTQLGVFTAVDQKAVQSFKLQSDGYGKYIKVELLSRYGSEHYCPLSLFRVYGTSMLEDYEQLDEKQQVTSQHSEEDDEERADNAEKSKNVVDRAKDAVMSILKVLRRDQEDGSAAVGNASCSQDGEDCDVVNTSAAMLNATQKLRCRLPRAVAPAFESCIVCSHLDYVAGNIPSQTHTSSVCHFLRAALTPVDECVENSLVVPKEEPASNQQSFTTKGDSSTEKVVTSSTTLFTNSMESATDEATESKSAQPSSSSSSATISSPRSSELKMTHSVSQPASQSPYTDDATPSSDVTNHTIFTPNSSEEGLTTSNLQSSAPTSTFPEATVAATPTIAALPVEIETSASTLPLAGSEVVSDSPLAVNDIPVVPGVQEQNETVSQHSGEVEGDLAKEGSAKDWSKHMELGSTSGNQKESVFMRINNRIKVLELNMSLSSQYLEELSQRYRKQMEDMQRNFNHTINALNETTRIAAEKDHRQQEALVQLQQQLDNLTIIIDALLSDRRSISKEVFETHVCLIVIEAVVLATVFSLCLRRVQAPPLQHGMRNSHHMQRPASRTSLKRRNTESECEQLSCTAQDVIAEKKQKPSEESIESGSRVVIVEPVIPIIMDSNPKEKAKKHKNKKHKGCKRKGSVPEFGPDGLKQPGVNGDVVDKTTSAGVLFSSPAVLSTSMDVAKAHVTSAKLSGVGLPNQKQHTKTSRIPSCTASLGVVTHKWKQTTYGLCSQDTKLGLMKIFPHADKTPV